MDDNRAHLKKIILEVFERASFLVETIERNASLTETIEETTTKLRGDFSIYAALKNNALPDPILESLSMAIQADADEADFSGLEHLEDILEGMSDESDAEKSFRNAYLAMDMFSAYLNLRKASLN